MDVTNIRGFDLAHSCSPVLDDEHPTLVWGHGLTSSVVRESLFGLLAWPRIEHVARVVRYDARGHGESGSTPDPGGYHWRELALDQLALADELELDSYVAGGASMGCATALHAALLAPGRISGLLLAIPPTAWDTRAAQQATYEVSARLVEDGQIDELVDAARSTPPPDPLSAFPEWRDGVEETMRAADPVRLARIYRGAAIADLPPPEDIAELRLPTLILAWTGDAGHPMSTARRLVELMPDAEMRTASTFNDLVGWTAAAIEFLTGPKPGG